MLSSANIKKVMAFLILLWTLALYKFVLFMTPVTRTIKMTIMYILIFWSSMLQMKGIT